MEFYPALLDQAASDAMAKRIESAIAERSWGLWAAELRSTGEFTGYIGLSVPPVKLPFSPCVEIGWRLAHAFWGKGLPPKAPRARCASASPRSDSRRSFRSPR